MLSSVTQHPGLNKILQILHSHKCNIVRWECGREMKSEHRAREWGTERKSEVGGYMDSRSREPSSQIGVYQFSWPWRSITPARRLRAAWVCEEVEKRRKRGHVMCRCSVYGRAGVLRTNTLIWRELTRSLQATDARNARQNLSLRPCAVFVQSAHPFYCIFFNQSYFNAGPNSTRSIHQSQNSFSFTYSLQLFLDPSLDLVSLFLLSTLSSVFFISPVLPSLHFCLYYMTAHMMQDAPSLLHTRA